ncbi:MAG: hypothetical protein H6730_14015 [Deltaproteobacteria bacterium]|nr:hypothetical protein [Deltaproteobacteria bacterium]
MVQVEEVTFALGANQRHQRFGRNHARELAMRILQRRELVAVEKQASMLRRGVDGLLDAGANRRHVGLVDAVVPSDARPQLKLVRARAGR